MSNTHRVRKTAILTLVLACVLFTAGAGQASALDRPHDADFGGHLVIDLLERIGSFVSDLTVEVIEIFHKETPAIGADG